MNWEQLELLSPDEAGVGGGVPGEVFDELPPSNRAGRKSGHWNEWLEIPKAHPGKWVRYPTPVNAGYAHQIAAGVIGRPNSETGYFRAATRRAVDGVRAEDVDEEEPVARPRVWLFVMYAGPKGGQ